MWIFTRSGYLAITQNKEHKGLFHVRSRVKGDIERYWPTAEVEYTPEADYLYRTNLPKTEVMNAIGHAIMAITYTSFKGSIEDVRRKPYIMDVWTATVGMQEAILESEDADI
jgi:hypothetical protein